tara:strand:- start:126 stop:761 length:636 start_codon:yes stop_codon:yes gene_type:complete
MIEIRKNVQAGETPPKISVMQIDQDLKDGVSKSDMAVKYGIKPWEVDEMFKHPFLKGRRPSRKKALSFTFVDDTADYEDPNQVTLEEAINEAKDVTEAAIDSFANTTKEVVKILSPTLETPLETIQSIVGESSGMQSFDGDDSIHIENDEYSGANIPTNPDPIDEPEITGVPDGDKLSDTDDDEEVTPMPWGENQELKPVEVEEESDSFDM